MLYTRPKIEPLNLDLVRLDGGGSCPSQFHGTTVDGRSLYIRYRHGWLSAEWEDSGREPGSQHQELVEACIGPMFHGDILMEQVCDLLGLTLFGMTPPFTEEDRIKALDHRPIFDWSGRTTYWEELLKVTKEGGMRFVRELRAAFADVHILSINWNNGERAYVEHQNVDDCKGAMTIGINADRAGLQSILHSQHTILSDLKNSFSHVVNFGFDWDQRPDREFFANHERFNSRFYEAFGNEAVLADRNSGKISGEFATDEPNSLRFVDRLYEVINACFARKAAWVDPHGTVLQLRDMHALYSRDLTDWCRRSSHHYLSWLEKDFGNGKVIAGLRAL